MTAKHPPVYQQLSIGFKQTQEATAHITYICCSWSTYIQGNMHALIHRCSHSSPPLLPNPKISQNLDLSKQYLLWEVEAYARLKPCSPVQLTSFCRSLSNRSHLSQQKPRGEQGNNEWKKIPTGEHQKLYRFSNTPKGPRACTHIQGKGLCAETSLFSDSKINI